MIQVAQDKCTRRHANLYLALTYPHARRQRTAHYRLSIKCSPEPEADWHNFVVFFFCFSCLLECFLEWYL
jgi:hypothetical protein